LNSHGQIADRFAVSKLEMSSDFAQNRNSLWKACAQKIKGIVVMDGACESVLAAILTPAVFFASALLANQAPVV